MFIRATIDDDNVDPFPQVTAMRLTEYLSLETSFIALDAYRRKLAYLKDMLYGTDTLDSLNVSLLL